MFEEIGPAMVRSILGVYDPDYRYELNTTEEGLRVIVTHKTTGESKVVNLPDTPKEEEPRDSLLQEPEMLAHEHNAAFWAVLALMAVLGLALVYFVMKAGGKL